MATKNRFSISLPVDLAIKLNMELEKLKIPKNLFVVNAIKEKLENSSKKNTEASEINELRNEIDEIKKIIMKN
ncbi:MAG: hypothetical protein K2X69_13880 [Silvanigrellaceae bacterium]|nr:hypothetical protein [Silvanigrellaceae bacterium]